MPLHAAIDQALLQIALDLSTSLPRGTHYRRLIEAINKVLPCDASALLKLEQGQLVPVAVDGMVPEVMNRSFEPARHPRLKAILESRKPVRFPLDTPLPDPFDGLLLADHGGSLDVHACMGCSLYVEDNLIGVLTLDSLTETAFDKIDDITVATFAALAAATLRTASMIEALEKKSRHDRRLAREMMREAIGGKYEMLGDSTAMKALKNEIQMVASSDLSVLITGETGTGKELVAKSLHQLSRRSRQAMVHLNCAALPESVAESELFGHTKGAFTGAHANRAGKFELADGGTLFLDEIGELPLGLQAKLLRTLQSGEIQRVGSDREVKVDVRIIAATNRDLKQEVEEGNFREDLYHRLCVYPVQVPALRDRLDDIPLLAERFLEDARQKLGIQDLSIGGDAMSALAGYDWPGNVRELEHLVLRASLKAARRGAEPPVIGTRDLDLSEPSSESSSIRPGTLPATDLPFNEAVAEYQRRLIREALETNDGVWARAADALQLHRSNLHRLAKRLDILD